MSALALFAVGFAVSVVVFAALGLLILGAVLDGRDERDRKREELATTASVSAIRPGPRPIPTNGQGEAA
jgi:hypothetical protein